MKSTLHALLPIHVLRERRALRVLHERTAAHAQALAAREQAAADQARCHRASNQAIADLVSAGPMQAGVAQWSLHVAATFAARAEGFEAQLPQLALDADRASASAGQARGAHAERVRHHQMVREAAGRASARVRSVQTAAAEQRDDDDFAPRWFADRAVEANR